MFAKRMKYLESSGIRKMFEMAQKMKNPIDFSLGQPDFDVPEPVKKAAIDAIQTGRNRYSVTAGFPELREAIMDALSQEGVRPEAVMSVAGASGGLVLAFLALADECAEVLLTDPCFVTYGHLVRLTGAKLKWIDTYPDFRLTPKHLESAVEGGDSKIKQRILLFNSPVNPTGVAYTVSEIKALAETSRRLGLQVISDEVYDRFCYDFPHECWLKHDPNAILVRSFGKTWGVPGWRAGYAAGPKEIIDQMTMLQQFTFVCVNTPSQWAAIEALKTDVSPLIEAYQRKRDLVYEGLRGVYMMTRPQGAFYAFPEVPGGDAERFLNRCIEKELLIVPGKFFSGRNTHFRISFALDDETLKRGIEILVRIAR